MVVVTVALAYHWLAQYALQYGTFGWRLRARLAQQGNLHLPKIGGGGARWCRGCTGRVSGPTTGAVDLIVNVLVRREHSCAKQYNSKPITLAVCQLVVGCYTGILHEWWLTPYYSYYVLIMISSWRHSRQTRRLSPSFSLKMALILSMFVLFCSFSFFLSLQPVWSGSHPLTKSPTLIYLHLSFMLKQ